MSVSTAQRLRPHNPSDTQLFAANRRGDVRAREQLIERFIPLARKLALRYSYTEEPLEDLIQVACMGLVKAVDRYEPDRSTRFASFAVPTIVGELKRHFRDKGWAVHVPRALQEQALALGREGDRLARELGRSPTLRELAVALDWPYDRVLEAAEVAHSYHSTSLDAPVAREDNETATLGESIGREDDGYCLAESRDAISEAWRRLPELERRILVLRFRHDLPQRRIAELVGYSQMHVSRLLRRAVGKVLAAPEEADGIAVAVDR
jgi:RNA polymerase sigma-B factor